MKGIFHILANKNIHIDYFYRNRELFKKLENLDHAKILQVYPFYFYFVDFFLC